MVKRDFKYSERLSEALRQIDMSMEAEQRGEPEEMKEQERQRQRSRMILKEEEWERRGGWEMGGR